MFYTPISQGGPCPLTSRRQSSKYLFNHNEQQRCDRTFAFGRIKVDVNFVFVIDDNGISERRDIYFTLEATYIIHDISVRLGCMSFFTSLIAVTIIKSVHDNVGNQFWRN